MLRLLPRISGNRACERVFITDRAGTQRDDTWTPRPLEVLPIPRHRAPARPQHRASSRHAGPFAVVALTGIALGGSLLSPLTAAASPAQQMSGADHLPGDTRDVVPAAYHDSDDRDSDDRDSDDRDSDDRDSDDNDYADSDDRDSDYGDSDDSGRGYSGSGYSGDRDSVHRQPVTHARVSHHNRVAARQPAQTVARHASTASTGRTTHTRPMSSGEEQYRNGCRQGYIVEDCKQFDVPHLLQRGINPSL